MIRNYVFVNNLSEFITSLLFLKIKIVLKMFEYTHYFEANSLFLETEINLIASK